MENQSEDKTFFGIIIHSFFVIPFLIAISAVILFAAMHWLTREKLTAYDYLEQVKTGGSTKRWQSAHALSDVFSRTLYMMENSKRWKNAFELSKNINSPKLAPNDANFRNELTAVFKKSREDDPRVRKYLALAMARTGHSDFLNPLLEELSAEKDNDTKQTLIYALGMLQDKRAISTLLQYLDDKDSRIRSITVVALGYIGDSNISPALKKMLNDSEPNVQWGAAISLANFNDAGGKNILKQLLNRNYLSQYTEVDPQEQTQIVLQAITASSKLNDPELNEKIRQLTTVDPSMNVRSQALAALNK
jgi:hypothetical protein